MPTTRTTRSERFTASDLDALDLPEGWRAEITDGELYVRKAPDWYHQRTCSRVLAALERWVDHGGHGEPNSGPGVLYGEFDDVIPDVVWISRNRLSRALDSAGHLRGIGPELVIEVLSPGRRTRSRDLEDKLALYSGRDALEYWILDPHERTLRVYRRSHVDAGPLRHMHTVGQADAIVSTPLLEGFSARLADLLPRPEAQAG